MVHEGGLPDRLDPVSDRLDDGEARMKIITSAKRSLVRLTVAMELRRSPPIHQWMWFTAVVFFILTAIAWLVTPTGELTSGPVVVYVFLDRSASSTTRAQLDLQIRRMKDVYNRTSFALRDAGTIEMSRDSALLGQGINIVATSEVRYGGVANVRGQRVIFINPANAPLDMLTHEFAHVEIGHRSTRRLPQPIQLLQDAFLDFAVDFRLLIVRMRHR
jgi:hypothetical protein